MRSFPVETKRLVIRPFKLSDADAFYEMTRDSDIQRYLPCVCEQSLEKTRDEFKKYLKRDKDFYLMLEEKTTHNTVGALIAKQSFAKEYDMILMISVQHRRKDYMKEAIKAFFTVMPKGCELVFTIDKKNKSSYSLIRHFEHVQEVESFYPEYYYTFRISI